MSVVGLAGFVWLVFWGGCEMILTTEGLGHPRHSARVDVQTQQQDPSPVQGAAYSNLLAVTLVPEGIRGLVTGRDAYICAFHACKLLRAHLTQPTIKNLL